MTFGEHTATLRKRKGLSQGDLGKAVGTSGDIIGKYERDEVKPSIEVASKIADALEVGMDFLMGKTTAEPRQEDPQAFTGYPKTPRRRARHGLQSDRLPLA